MPETAECVAGKRVLCGLLFDCPCCCSIDCTSYFEFEAAQYQQKGITLSPEMWLVKMMVSGRTQQHPLWHAGCGSTMTGLMV